ncbi:MAG: hypothetical protein Q8Q08_05275 [Candidatus Omnitrophota bacterium]|nr:hypothetical protein [Candidatus Omnitrophota bacterium]
MKKILCGTVVLWLLTPLNAPAQTACDEFIKTYHPQSTPEQTYRLELDMMKQGAYCYDLDIFDPAWRKMAAKNSFSETHKSTAQSFDRPFKTYQEGKYAVIYYPGQKTLGPVFLYRENGVWLLDRTSVYQHIRYGQEWMVYDGDYPYLALLKKVFPLEEGAAGGGRKAYRLQE